MVAVEDSETMARVAAFAWSPGQAPLRTIERDAFVVGYQQAEAATVERIAAGLHDVAAKLRVGATTFEAHSRGLMEQLADEWDDAAEYVKGGDWKQP